MSKTQAFKILKNNTHPPIFLASSSKYRSALLDKLGITFQTASPEVDETPFPGERPEALARRLALAKSQTVAASVPMGLVIGSDQVASLDNRLIGKPGSMERATEQLKSSSGRCVEFHTALTVTNAASGESRSALETTYVQFRPLKHDQIHRYLEAERPFDCAGSFKSEGMGIILFQKIEGRDPNALVGLPLIALVDILAEFGVVLP